MVRQFVTPASLEALLRGEVDALQVVGPARDVARTGAVFPGSFNPLHEGHCQMAAIAAQRLRLPVSFEISIDNVDKAPLADDEINKRLSHFGEHQIVWLTCSDTFVKKARVFRSVTFLVGVDTIQRVADAAYYGGECRVRDRAVEQLHMRECRFLVFGRLIDGLFQQLKDCKLPPRLVEICDTVPERVFRRDISSRHLRE